MPPFRLNPSWLLLGALLLLSGSWFFKIYEAQRLERIEQESAKTRQQLQETLALQKLWEAKGLEKKLETIRRLIPPPQRKRFLKRHRSLELQVEGMEGRRLNRLLSKLGSLPLRFQKLDITRHNDRYSMECRCKW